jgi:hypothetical protein
MWPSITIIAFLLFLFAIFLLWKDTPSTPDWVTYEQVKKDFPKWTPLFVCLSFIFRRKSKTTFMVTVGGTGFLAMGAIWGDGFWEFLTQWLTSRPEIPETKQ